MENINKPKLSIVTICYNDYDVAHTCESIINQSWQKFEWIVVDGGSKEDIQKIYDKYKHRIDKFISEKDNGIYNACNKGIELATGEYVQFLNGGDKFHDTNVLEDVFRREKHDGDIIYGRIQSVYKDKNGKNEICVLPENIASPEFFITNNIRTPGMFIKKVLFEKYGKFNENYKIVSDLEKWIIFAKNGVSFDYTHTVIADFDMSGVSSSISHEALHNRELDEMYPQYYTKKQLKKRLDCRKSSFLEKIFSLKNSCDNKYKIITILNFKIRIKK